ncbi:hypothetical protein IWX65_002695 [Arthrobacter sp. CAN_A214]|uniref:hypothetical protein n=1 Tax=Arthrobacter sp. CAN_A214 TaxID=2787720 RepID=UPI0018CAE13D
MPAQENRALSNLILLCIEHSYEIDETPDLFPAELLREWKAAQMAEYDRIQRNWPINDDEATEALVASESFNALHAPSTIELVRRVEALRLTAERTRGATRAWAQHWQQLREQTRRSFNMWDDNGDPVYVEPSEMEVQPVREGIRSTLMAARNEIEPAAEAARIELAAVRVTRTPVGPWCDALDRAIIGVVDAASSWTGGFNPDQDVEFNTALADMERSVGDLVRASRGEQVEVPKSPQIMSEPEDVDPLAVHRELLNQARPFHRVNHRPYDPELRERVAEATREAAAIPPTAHFLAIGLDTTAALAVAVAGNATEDEQLELVEQDRQRLPICAAVALLQENIRRSDGQNAPAIAAREGLRRLWSDTDWSSTASWVGNDVNGQSMMWTFTRLTSVMEVHDRLADVVKTAPELLKTLVVFCAGWAERLDSRTWSLTGLNRTYREIPPWFPIEPIKAIAEDILPGEHPLNDIEILEMLLRHALGNPD